MFLTVSDICDEVFLRKYLTPKRLNALLHKKCPYLQLFWSAFSRIRTEYGEIGSISSYSVQMKENADQNNSEYEHFSPMRLCEVNFWDKYFEKTKTRNIRQEKREKNKKLISDFLLIFIVMSPKWNL